MKTMTLAIYLQTISILALTACGPQAPKTTIKPTGFAANVAKAEKEAEVAPSSVDSKDDAREKELAEKAKFELEMAGVDNKREKLKLIQERLTNKENQKIALETQISAIDTEIAKVVLPPKNSAAAGFYAYNGDYATAFALQQQAKAAYAAAETKKLNLANLATEKKAELVALAESVELIKAEVEALSKEIETSTEAVYTKP